MKEKKRGGKEGGKEGGRGREGQDGGRGSTYFLSNFTFHDAIGLR